MLIVVPSPNLASLLTAPLLDVIFNAGSIAFPISKRQFSLSFTGYIVLTCCGVGFYAKIWWLDALGGLLLSIVVIYNWSSTSAGHIKNLCGFSATADQRNIRKMPPRAYGMWPLC